MQPENVVMLNIDLLIPNDNQPRKYFNESAIDELSISIKKYGILNPILVFKKENNYVIIAGERRYRAAKKAGLKEVPVIIKDIDEKQISEIALIENLQRENLTPIEEARTYEEILKNQNITEQTLSELIGKSQPFISNKIRLLKLPLSIQEALNNHKISEKHARSLLNLNDISSQEELLDRIINEKLSVKDLDNIIKNKKEEKESDNMNNGSFFPNFNEPNNNMSLNNMNMQAMNVPNTGEPVPVQGAPVVEAPIAQAPAMSEPILPTPDMAAPLPQVEIQNMEPTPEPTPVAQPTFDPGAASPIPDFGVNAPAMQVPTPMEPVVEQPVPEPIQVETPSPISFETPVVEVAPPQVEAPVLPEAPQPMPAGETPLFNAELNEQPKEPNLNESFYEVPVNVSPVIETPQVDKLQTVKELLSSNNIEYKIYSNEEGHCIIIEL